MRAVIPAVVLLFIGLVAALPFRRPATSLHESPSGSTLGSGSRMIPAELPTRFMVPQSSDESSSWSRGTSGTAQLPNQSEPMRPMAANYGEIMVPLAQPVRKIEEPTASPPPQVAGVWRNGLEIPGGMSRITPDQQLPPPMPANAIVSVPVESPLINQPPRFLDPPKANAQLAVAPISAVHPSGEGSQVEALPAPQPQQPERARQYIREPQR